MGFLTGVTHQESLEVIYDSFWKKENQEVLGSLQIFSCSMSYKTVRERAGVSNYQTGITKSFVC